MTRAAVHQLLPTFSPRDAVGNSTLELAELLRRLGYESHIYANDIHHELARKAEPIAQLPDDDSWVIYHHSIGSTAGDAYERRAGRRILMYHNITPLELVERWAPQVGAEILLGREQTARYSHLTDVAVAASDYNRAELDALGYPKTTTIPVMFELDRLAVGVSARRSAHVRIVFVGRLAPNKAQHDLIASLAVLRSTDHPEATLHLVGARTFGSYSDAIRDYTASLGLADAVFVHEAVTDDELADHYSAADVFVCLSDHEGFCVPIIEAMHRGLPVIAFNSSAVGATVGDGGLVLDSKSPDIVAAAISRVHGDEALRTRMGDAGRRRAAQFRSEHSRTAWAKLIESVAGNNVA